MTQTKITIVGKFAAVLLPQEMVDQMGVQIGDDVDIVVRDDTLVVRRIAEGEQPERPLDEIIDDIFKRRADAYRRLAEGAD